MRVYVRGKWYDWKDEPVMIELTDKNKADIAAMHPEMHKYCEYPDGTPTKDIIEWMEKAGCKFDEDWRQKASNVPGQEKNVNAILNRESTK